LNKNDSHLRQIHKKLL